MPNGMEKFVEDAVLAQLLMHLVCASFWTLNAGNTINSPNYANPVIPAMNSTTKILVSSPPSKPSVILCVQNGKTTFASDVRSDLSLILRPNYADQLTVHAKVSIRLLGNVSAATMDTN